MSRSRPTAAFHAATAVLIISAVASCEQTPPGGLASSSETQSVTVASAVRRDVSGLLSASATQLASEVADDSRDGDVRRHALAAGPNEDEEREREAAEGDIPVMSTPPGSAEVEQTTFGTKPPARLVATMLVLAVLAASWIPARRAAGVPAIEALRSR